MIQGPLGTITVAPMYFTRGYVFHTFEHDKHWATANYGISVRGDSDFYGVLTDKIEVQYPGLLNLKCIVFKCEWYDPTIGRGVRLNKSGVVDVNVSRRYQKFEPFVLGSQVEQVAFVPYPRVNETGITWLSVIRVAPRGIVVGGTDEVALQADVCGEIEMVEQTSDDILLIDPQNRELDDIVEDVHGEDVDEEEQEFEETTDIQDEDDDDGSENRDVDINDYSENEEEN